MNPKASRNVLITRMEELNGMGLDCRNCAGTCCSFEANSMLITPLEAFDLYEYLKSKNLLSKDLRKKLSQVVISYRLEPKFFRARSYLRKTYTCPFFNHGELGCPLPVEVKPIGCLAFNSHHQEKKASTECFSETELLEKRERENPHEEKINEDLRRRFNLLWEKAPIPNALLDFWENSSGDDPQLS